MFGSKLIQSLGVAAGLSDPDWNAKMDAAKLRHQKIDQLIEKLELGTHGKALEVLIEKERDKLCSPGLAAL